jgi:hypothetical protein
MKEMISTLTMPFRTLRLEEKIGGNRRFRTKGRVVAI